MIEYLFLFVYRTLTHNSLFKIIKYNSSYLWRLYRLRMLRCKPDDQQLLDKIVVGILYLFI